MAAAFIWYLIKSFLPRWLKRRVWCPAETSFRRRRRRTRRRGWTATGTKSRSTFSGPRGWGEPGKRLSKTRTNYFLCVGNKTLPFGLSYYKLSETSKQRGITKLKELKCIHSPQALLTAAFWPTKLWLNLSKLKGLACQNLGLFQSLPNEFSIPSIVRVIEHWAIGTWQA